ncbi:MAG TPA: metalloregulator ArsR/SmtB family transcription factor [Terriglobus sp.]
MRKSAAATAQSATVFAALGDATRLSLLQHLSEGGDQSIQSLTQTTSVTRQAVTKHLHVLEHAGLVRCREHGRERHYALAPNALDSAQEYLEAIARHWDNALLRLKAHVETK